MRANLVRVSDAAEWWRVVRGPVTPAIADPAFAALESEARFKQVIAATKPPPARPKAESWSTASGETLAKVTQDEDRVSLTIDRRKSPEFAEFVLTRLRDLYAEFKAGA